MVSPPHPPIILVPACLPGKSDLLHVEMGPHLTPPTLSLHVGILATERRKQSISSWE